MRHGAGLEHTQDMGERKLVVVGNCIQSGVAESKASSRKHASRIEEQGSLRVAPGTRPPHTKGRRLRRI